MLSEKSLGSIDPDGRRNVLNIALFDVCSVMLAKYHKRLTQNPSAGKSVKLAFRMLLSDDRFTKAITYSTNSTQAVTTRFELTEQVLNECFS